MNKNSLHGIHKLPKDLLVKLITHIQEYKNEHYENQIKELKERNKKLEFYHLHAEIYCSICSYDCDVDSIRICNGCGSLICYHCHNTGYYVGYCDNDCYCYELGKNKEKLEVNNI